MWQPHCRLWLTFHSCLMRYPVPTVFNKYDILSLKRATNSLAAGLRSESLYGSLNARQDPLALLNGI